MVELEDRWMLTSEGAEVTRVCFDWGVGLTIGPSEPQTDIRIECHVILVDRHGSAIELAPEGSPHALAPLLRLLRQPVNQFEVMKDGHLKIRTGDGDVLTVAPSTEFEAWEISGPDGYRMVCSPGGEVTVWSDRGLG